jgi:hypothetical protein
MKSRRRSITACAVGLLLAASLAAADEPSGASGPTSSHTEKSGAPCPGGGGRVSKCSETVHVVTEREVTTTIKVAPITTKNCQATITTSSDQRNTVARVQGTVDIADCKACSGGYTIVVRIRDETGETKALEFEGSWQRTDDQPVKFTAEYPIGDNVDLLGVRPKGIRCVCADAPAAAAAQPKE